MKGFFNAYVIKAYKYIFYFHFLFMIHAGIR
jgi:hypothetical protein